MKIFFRPFKNFLQIVLTWFSQLNTTNYSEFICCDPCLQTFTTFSAYRDSLINNQLILDSLWNCSTTGKYPEKQEDALEQVIIKEEPDDGSVKEESFQYEPETDFASHWSYAHDNLEVNTLSPQVLINEDPEEYEEKPRARKASSNKRSTAPAPKKKYPKKVYPKKKLDQPIICSECGREFIYRSNFRIHFREVHQKTVQGICHLCGKEYLNKRSFKLHMMTHQPNLDKPFKCDKCPWKFSSSVNFMRHKRVS